MIDTIKQRLRHLTHRPLLLAILAFSLLPLVLGTIYASRYFPARARLNTATAAARANGEPVWFSDLDPGQERNPSEDAVRLLELCEKIVLWKDDKEIEEKIWDLRNPSRREGPIEFTTADDDRLNELSVTNADVLREIATIARRRDCWFAYDYETVSTYGILCPHLDRMRDANLAATANVLAGMGDPDGDEFLNRIHRYLDVPDALRNEPFLVSQNIRMGWIDLEISLIERRYRSSPIQGKRVSALEDRLKTIERDLTIAPNILESRATTLTAMENLDNDENREVLLSIHPPLFEVNSDSWLDFLPINPQTRELNRWSSLGRRPWLMEQEVFYLDFTGRIAHWIDEPGPSARQEVEAIENEITALKTEMPLCTVFISQYLYIRDRAMAIRQRLICASTLLRLSRIDPLETFPSNQSIADLDSAITEAPAGYFSGNPLQYEIEGSTISLFDVNPEDGSRMGEFTLQFPDSISEVKNGGTEESQAP